ncbi:MAG: hypothetical protein ACREQ5_10700 [Candidatus Dormibacteria bacterium]
MANPFTNPEAPAVTGPTPTTGAGEAHLVVGSILVLIAAAFAFQGVADSGPQAHKLVLALLVGVVILLTMQANASGHLAWLRKYPYTPPAGG